MGSATVGTYTIILAASLSIVGSTAIRVEPPFPRSVTTTDHQAMKEIPVLYYAITAPDRLTDVGYEDLSKASEYALEEKIRLERLQHGRLKYYHDMPISLQRATDKLLPVLEKEIGFYVKAGCRLAQYMNTRSDQPMPPHAADDDLPY